MQSTIKTTNKTYKCQECDNENTLEVSKKLGELAECEFCGIEYEIIEMDEAGEAVLQIIEEDK